MTCIVAVTDNDGAIWMGADSLGVAGLGAMNRRDPKIYRVGEFLFGFTSSYRMGQLLGYAFKPPEHHAEWSDHRYMVTAFIDAVRKTFKDGGFAEKDKDAESGGCFLVAYRGRIWNIESDYQVGESAHGFDAVGCGERFALGALYASRDRPARERLIGALAAAEEFSAGVRRPFVLKQQPMPVTAARVESC